MITDIEAEMECDEDEGYDDPEIVQKLYATANYMLRESRKAVLRRHQVEDESVLLEKIRSGQEDCHPAYGNYLSARILEQTRSLVRAGMMAQLGCSTLDDNVPPLLHQALRERLEAHYGDRLAAPVRLAQDALLLSFDTGLLMEVRYYSAEEYMLSWSWGDAELRIDTAPSHPECSTFPHHLHGDDGTVRADPVTLPGTDWWSNVSRLLDVLLVNPLLEPATQEQGEGGN